MPSNNEGEASGRTPEPRDDKRTISEHLQGGIDPASNLGQRIIICLNACVFMGNPKKRIDDLRHKETDLQVITAYLELGEAQGVEISMMSAAPRIAELLETEKRCKFLDEAMGAGHKATDEYKARSAMIEALLDDVGKRLAGLVGVLREFSGSLRITADTHYAHEALQHTCEQHADELESILATHAPEK